jgi:hypothetical protein
MEEGVPTPWDHLTTTTTTTTRIGGAYAPEMSCSKCGLGTHLTSALETHLTTALVTHLTTTTTTKAVFALQSSLSINCIERFQS